MQSKTKSFLESVINTFVGFLITVIFSPLIYWMAGVKVNYPEITLLAVLFTVLSVARNYVIRRIFNKQEK